MPIQVKCNRAELPVTDDGVLHPSHFTFATCVALPLFCNRDIYNLESVDFD